MARERAARLGGHTRRHIPSPDEPLSVLVIGELADLTAYPSVQHHFARA